MKHTRCLALFLAFTFATVAAQAQVSNADTMIHRLFTSLKAKDEKAFVALYPNGPQMAKLMRNMMEKMFKSEEMQKMMAADPNSKNLNVDSLINAQLKEVTKPEAQVEMQQKFGKSFQDIIAKGEKKGVNWSQAQLVSYTIDTAMKNDQDMKLFGSNGMKVMNGVVDFTAGGNPYQMNFEKIVFLPEEGGWFGGEFKEVIRKGESFRAGGDSGVDSVAEETAPPAKTKTKTKTTGGSVKTKTKTKTPARKPGTKS